MFYLVQDLFQLNIFLVDTDPCILWKDIIRITVEYADQKQERRDSHNSENF